MSNAARKNTDEYDALVYGLGNSGLSIARYLKRHNLSAVYYDQCDAPSGLDALREIDSSARVILGENTKGLLKSVRTLIVSPGVPESDAVLRKARKKKMKISSDIEIFVENTKSPFVAVTGSNGKSTVVTLLAMMCDASGKQALAGANLGHPVLDMLVEPRPDFYVLELSSFQLQRTPNLPAQVAALLNISPDHLDWHTNEDEYVAAKYRVFREAKAVVFNRAEPHVEHRFPANVPQISFGLDTPDDGHYGIRVDGDIEFLARGEQLLLAVEDMALVGKHNQANALAALSIGELMGLETSAMLQVLNEFPGLPHRMQFVDQIVGTTYINDSKATNIGAAIASIESIEGYIVLIAGGDGKGNSFSEFAKTVHRRLRGAVVLGVDGPKLAQAFDGLAPVYQVENMHDAVKTAATIALSGDTVLLAPACASFDQYESYQHRGDDFRQAVGALSA